MQYQYTPDGACKSEGVVGHPRDDCVKRVEVDGEKGGQAMRDAASCYAEEVG
jgi:hypothetical protein